MIPPVRCSVADVHDPRDMDLDVVPVYSRDSGIGLPGAALQVALDTQPKLEDDECSWMTPPDDPCKQAFDRLMDLHNGVSATPAQDGSTTPVTSAGSARIAGYASPSDRFRSWWAPLRPR